MCEFPGKGRETCVGRPIGLHRTNLSGEIGSIGPFFAESKNPTDKATRADFAARESKHEQSREFNLACACARADLELRKRSAGSVATENGKLEVGGSGGTGMEATGGHPDGGPALPCGSGAER
jgi:hypothetical protein